jgi:DNA-binding NarL/FixJ family response regulator
MRRRVLIANADPAERARLKTSVRADGHRICAYAGDARDAVDRAVRTEPDICVVAAALPGGGARAAVSIAAQLPNAGVVVLAA